MEKYYFLMDQFSPRNASVNWDPSLDLPEDLECYFKEYMQLPLFLRFGLGSELVSEAVFLLAQKMGWEKDPQKSGEISRLVRDIFLRNLRENELLLRIKEKFGLMTTERQFFYQEIKRLAILVKKEGEREFAEEYERLSLLKIINTYPEIRDQKVSELPIYLENKQNPVVPSVENWIQDYLLETGSSKHNTLERSHFLFESENAKNLNSTERKKLAILLKSYDEGFELIFNKVDRRIELEDSLKIDEEKLASLNFFLKDTNMGIVSQKKVDLEKFSSKKIEKTATTKNGNAFLNGEKKVQMKNVLDLSKFV